MKQILIVNSAKALNHNNATPKDLSVLTEGAITFFELGADSALSAAPTKNFGIALGLGHNSPAFVIPEVDIKSLSVAKTLPAVGNVFTFTFTMPTTVVGKEYTIVMVKRSTVPHERRTYTFMHTAGTTTAATEASAFVTAINNKAQAMALPFTASVSTAAITITGATVNDDWEIKLTDGLSGVSFGTHTLAKKHIGDKAYVQDLASRCAYGKGFADTYASGASNIPGYPEPVEDLTPNSSGSSGASTAGYAIYTLRFAVPRVASKTRDEVVNQIVHIAVPITNSSFSTIDSIIMGATSRVDDTLEDHEDRITALEA